mmetsp:Transcript_7081/g.20709  ORF Transcript_7081/g.20709 Transcript_7081/m.20709 type:complete len:258 (+) Transcript_7081:3315-4088(+)
MNGALEARRGLSRRAVGDHTALPSLRGPLASRFGTDGNAPSLRAAMPSSSKALPLNPPLPLGFKMSGVSSALVPAAAVGLPERALVGTGAQGEPPCPPPPWGGLRPLRLCRRTASWRGREARPMGGGRCFIIPGRGRNPVGGAASPSECRRSSPSSLVSHSRRCRSSGSRGQDPADKWARGGAHTRMPVSSLGLLLAPQGASRGEPATPAAAKFASRATHASRSLSMGVSAKAAAASAAMCSADASAFAAGWRLGGG